MDMSKSKEYKAVKNLIHTVKDRVFTIVLKTIRNTYGADGIEPAEKNIIIWEYTSDELYQRRKDFLIKLNNLMSEYQAVIGYTYYGDNPNTYYIVTDGDINESWENRTRMYELEEDDIEREIKKIDALLLKENIDEERGDLRDRYDVRQNIKQALGID